MKPNEPPSSEVVPFVSIVTDLSALNVRATLLLLTSTTFSAFNSNSYDLETITHSIVNVNGLSLVGVSSTVHIRTFLIGPESAIVTASPSFA